MILISYGPISKSFSVIATLANILIKIKEGKVKQQRLDCYPITTLVASMLKKHLSKLKIHNCNSFEVFRPSEKYPSHIDEGSISYFIPLESGNFVIGDVCYPIVPFVVYRFDDGMPHNSNFASVMFK